MAGLVVVALNGIAPQVVRRLQQDRAMLAAQQPPRVAEMQAGAVGAQEQRAQPLLLPLMGARVVMVCNPLLLEPQPTMLAAAVVVAIPLELLVVLAAAAMEVVQLILALLARPIQVVAAVAMGQVVITAKMVALAS
jgi:hypothetical protein